MGNVHTVLEDLIWLEAHFMLAGVEAVAVPGL